MPGPAFELASCRARRGEEVLSTSVLGGPADLPVNHTPSLGIDGPTGPGRAVQATNATGSRAVGRGSSHERSIMPLSVEDIDFMRRASFIQFQQYDEFAQMITSPGLPMVLLELASRLLPGMPTLAKTRTVHLEPGRPSSGRRLLYRTVGRSDAEWAGLTQCVRPGDVLCLNWERNGMDLTVSPYRGDVAIGSFKFDRRQLFVRWRA